MKIGFLTFNAAAGIHPAKLAIALEERGYESIWVPEHTNIPVDRSTPYIKGGSLPDAYRQMMSPMISLAAAASVTSELRLATGVLLALQHDVIDIALQTATLDVLSGGRLLLGVGVGWNAEELANHRPDLEFSWRYVALEERIAAMRALWRDDISEFDGRWDRVQPTWVYPKPVQPTIPIAFGSSAPRGMRLAATHADHWMPILGSLRGADGEIDLIGRVTAFRQLAAGAGRDPEDIPITVLAVQLPSEQIWEQCQALGIERVVISLGPEANPTEAETLQFLDDNAYLVAANA